MSHLIHRHLLPVRYTCWLCSHKSGEVAFTSRNAFRSHLVFVHRSDITRTSLPGNKSEDIITECNPVELAAKRRKFQLRTASPAERRAIYGLEQRYAKDINILPRYVPSIHTQTTRSLQSGREGEGGEEEEEEEQVYPQSASQLPVAVQEQFDSQQLQQQSNQVQQHSELSQAVADDSVSQATAEPMLLN